MRARKWWWRVAAGLLALLSVVPAACDRGSGSGARKESEDRRAAPDQLDRTVSSLIDRLGTDSGSDDAIGALVALGPVVLDRLAIAMEQSAGSRRRAAIAVLREIGTPEAVPLLLRSLTRGSDWETRLAAVEALGELGDRRAVRPLITQYHHDDDSQVRYECLTSLGLIGDPAAVDFLRGEAGTADPYARMWAIDALCHMRVPEAAALASAALLDPSPLVRSQVLRSCGQAFDTAESQRVLIDMALHGTEFKDSVWARRHLRYWRLQSRDGAELASRIERIATAALDGPARVRASMLLGDLGDDAATPGLIGALDDPDPWVRHHAAFLLGQLGDRRGVDPLILALGDQERLVAATAHDALKHLAEAGDARAQSAVRAYAGPTFGKALPQAAGSIGTR